MVEKIKKKKGSVLICSEPSRTQQHFKKSCDINEIYNSYCNRNIPLPVKRTTPKYGEITVKSLLEAQELIDTVNDEFYSLSADIRTKFDNDPSKLVEFVGNVDNKTAAIELGLLPRPEKEYHNESCSTELEPSPNYLSLTGEGDTSKIIKEAQIEVSDKIRDIT